MIKDLVITVPKRLYQAVVGRYSNGVYYVTGNFSSDEEASSLLDRLVDEYEKRTSMIALPVWIGAHAALLAGLRLPERAVIMGGYPDLRRRLKLTFGA